MKNLLCLAILLIIGCEMPDSENEVRIKRLEKQLRECNASYGKCNIDRVVAEETVKRCAERR